MSRRATAVVGRHLDNQRQDVFGIVLILLGVLFGLGIYGDAAGPVGGALEAVALGLLGLVGYAVPVVVAWLGLVVIVGRGGSDLGRIIVGGVFGLLALLAALHLGVGAPDPAEGLSGLWEAGGIIGWALATPLVWALSQWGAIAVLVAMGTLGLLIMTRTPFSQVVATVRNVASRDGSGGVGDQSAAVDSDHAGRPEGEDEVTEVMQSVAGAAGDPSVDGVAPTGRRPRATLQDVDEFSDETTSPADDAIDTDDADDAEGEVTTLLDATTMVDAVDPKHAAKAVAKARKVAPVRSWDDYELPPMDLLNAGRLAGSDSDRQIGAQVEALQETFHQFSVDATVARWSRGPTVTRFEIELGPGVQVKKVANMGDDIAYALAAPDVRIVAPIPGKSAIGVEVPNRKRDLITLGDILRSDDAIDDPHPMTVALGVDIAGVPALVNLTTMPHLLVSGSTGSGKSVTLNGMISSIIMRTRPDQVRMILIDPKRVELNAYEGAPHLLSPVVTDPRRATDAVQWCVKEMEQRYERLAIEGFRNIDGYNDALRAGKLEARPGPDGTMIEPRELPYILLVIDELADLMLVAPRDVEDAICRIAQMARAVGIHMIIATQRPSVDVITGLIKANIPSRLALAVASQTDSRTILDANGAEKLVGKGDMLFLPASQGKPSRLQGCWVTETEVANIVAFCKAQREPEFDKAVVKSGEAAAKADSSRVDDGSDEALLRRAAEQVVVSGLGSTSMLQRKLRIGFARAGRLMDELEELGVVGPNEGSKAREVLWGPEELEEGLERGVL
ncbi:MAG: DNA translocase FtsK [Nitriliruptoraceae bacterium]